MLGRTTGWVDEHAASASGSTIAGIAERSEDTSIIDDVPDSDRRRNDARAT